MTIGIISANSEAEVIGMIRSRKLTPVNIESEAAKGSMDINIGIFKQKVKAVDLTMFCKQLSTMMKAGIPLNRAIDIQIAQTDNKTMQNALLYASAQIKQGASFSKAMKQFPKVFPVLLVNMVEAGEMTGQLDDVLARMYVHYYKENKINNKIKGAMIYPIVLCVLTVALIVGMLTFVMPMFADLFASGGGELPIPTRIMLGLSNAIRGYWYIFIAVIIAVVIGVRYTMRTTEGRLFFDKMKITFPVIRKPMCQIITSRFARTLSSLLTSGISIIKALESATEITNNHVIINQMNDVINDVKKGVALSSLLKKVPIFPPMMVSMVNIGEETGSIDDLLQKTADYYDEELESALARLVALLEPAMIVFMGISIGMIVISMLLPMFEMFNYVA